MSNATRTATGKNRTEFTYILVSKSTYMELNFELATTMVNNHLVRMGLINPNYSNSTYKCTTSGFNLKTVDRADTLKPDNGLEISKDYSYGINFKTVDKLFNTKKAVTVLLLDGVPTFNTQTKLNEKNYNSYVNQVNNIYDKVYAKLGIRDIYSQDYVLIDSFDDVHTELLLDIVTGFSF